MQHWIKLNHHEREPCKRSVHAAVCLGYGGSKPQLLVTGGRDSQNKVLNDMWILDTESERWREVREPYDSGRISTVEKILLSLPQAFLSWKARGRLVNYHMTDVTNCGQFSQQ